MADPNVTDLLNNLAKNMPAVAELVYGAMYLAGFILIFRGIYAFKQYGELRTMMSVNADLKTPILYTLIGAGLIFTPSLINVSLTTIYSSTDVLSYTNISTWSQQANQAMADSILVLRVIGYISFFRGWIILSHLGGQGSPPGTFGKGLLHILGGILLVNIVGSWDIIESTLGLGGS